VRVVFAFDYVHGDTEHGYAERRHDGSCVRDSNVLPGRHAGGGLGAGRFWRRNLDAAGGDAAWRDRMDVQTGPASGGGVCDGDDDYDRARGVRELAEGPERSDAGGDVYDFVEFDVEWTYADLAEFSDFGCEVGFGIASGTI
jgi:hypothetical protein